ncbi:SDR family oxidoreductase [Leucobacter allii]|uniref:SDR family oxidoreductase n=1 Tax=Leucobacter allii TaxID=2932247 RepID=A0ABY4FN90_9MICO|nr:NAD(P)-binding oxidoreductase [Leucobacter allii]UOQ57745.1 SDR family oxidoreductase [Leucobacter allii]
MSTIAVFGSTGQTGHRIVDRLAHDGHDVLAISRRPTGGDSPRIRTAAADLTHTSVDELCEILSGIDAVVFAAAGDPIRVDRDGALRVIDAAERAGVTRFVLITGMGVGRPRPSEYYGGFWDTYFGAKEASERALRTSTLAWTILQPGELLNERGRGHVELAPTGSLPISAVTRDDVAAVVGAVVDRADTAGHGWELVHGDRTIEGAIERAVRR